MAGISAFTVPTPEFGPDILATALWALVLLHYWRAVGKGKQTLLVSRSAVEIGLLLLTTYAGLVLVVLLLAFTLATRHGRERLMTVYPWIAGVLIVLVVFPHLIWLDQTGGAALINPSDHRGERADLGPHRDVAVVLAHAGFIVLVAGRVGFSWSPRGPAAQIERKPVDPQARLFVYFFALAPVVVIGPIPLVTSRPDSFVSTPLVVLSGLAIVVASPGQAADHVSASDRNRVGRASGPAAADRRAVGGGAAVDFRHRHAGHAAGGRDGAVLRRQLPAPHRAPA